MTSTVFTTLRNSMREKFKIHSVETVSDVSHESNVKIATNKTNEKRDQKVKRIKNIAGRLPEKSVAAIAS